MRDESEMNSDLDDPMEIEKLLNGYMKEEDFRREFLVDPLRALRNKKIFLDRELEACIVEASKNVWNRPRYIYGSNLPKQDDLDSATYLFPEKKEVVMVPLN
jgi:hypothetical protein